MRIIKACLIALAGSFGVVCTAKSQSIDAVDAGAPPRIIWRTQDFFGPCQGDCSLALYGGREITTPMSSVFLIHNAIAPWNDQSGDAGVIATAISRRFGTMFGSLDLEAEAGIDQRFGDMQATTGWLAVVFRWVRFPWNDIVATTIAFADGPSMASEIDAEERLRSQNGHGSDFLNFASPEVTLALPDDPQDELVFRYQHRSGIFGLINGVDEASSFACIGFRHAF